MTVTEKARETFAVELSNVSVRFKVPTEKIVSFKEYVLRRLARQLSYRELWALRDLDLRIPPGEIFGVIGRNGAGKSTLLRVVSRVLHPTEGRVLVRGNLAPMLQLGAGFHPDLTGTENVLLNATILGMPKKAIQEHLEEVIAFAELEAFANAPIRTYSSGMVGRLGFAVATLFRPDILVLDEVLAVGDIGFKDKCFDRLREFVKSGTTVLLVSHSPPAIERYCRQVAWLDQGRLAALGTPDEVLPLYLTSMGKG